jgi:replication factor C subunit 2/4
VLGKLGQILLEEKIIVANDEVIETIANVTDGDMRRSIMLLQNLKYLQLGDKPVTKDDVYQLAGIIPTKFINAMESVCFNPSVPVKKLAHFAKKITSKSYSIYNVMDEVLEMIVNSDLDDIDKSNIAMYFLEIEKQLLAGSDEYLQFIAVLVHIKSVINKINCLG